MDQTKTAGIGNYILAEALYAARIHPWARVGDVAQDDAVIAALHSAIALWRPRAVRFVGDARADASDRCWCPSAGSSPPTKCALALEQARSKLLLGRVPDKRSTAGELKVRVDLWRGGRFED